MEVASLIIDAHGFASGEQDLMATIKEELHGMSDIFGQALALLVQDKTPVRTGALRSDIVYTPIHDVSDDDIVYIHAEGTEQIAEWGRIYVQYQEGKPLGERTYTNDPRQMFLLTAQGDGFDVVEALAYLAVDTASILCVAGMGVPF